MWQGIAGQGRRLLRRLAGGRLTVAGLAGLGAGVAGIYALDLPPTWTLALPAALLAVNLATALGVNPALRRSGGLLVFHVALLAFLVMLVAGRLTYLRGRVEVTEGTAFTGTLNEAVAGPLHPWHLPRAAFLQGPFEIPYRADGSRGDISSQVSWMDARGTLHQAAISERRPLVLAGYRLAPTANKGFAAVFSWRPEAGAAQVGSVHFPAYPLNAELQARDWSLPAGGGQLFARLVMAEPPVPEAGPGRFRLPDEHHLVLRRGDLRRELSPGDSVQLEGGELRYLRLGTWMGYNVFYDPTVPWLLACAVVGCLGLGAHYAFAGAPREREVAP